jgi:hypothetical protein
MTSGKAILSTLPKTLPAVPLNTVGSSLQMLVTAYQDYQRIAEEQKTKRAAVAAWERVRTEELRQQRTLLETYFTGVFEERRHVIEGFFATLDRAIDSGNDALLTQSISGILAVARQSPLAEAAQLLEAMRNPNVNVIDV